MPAATTKTELLTISQKEYDKLAALIRPLRPAVALHKREDDTSIKDVIVHRGHWIHLFLGWYASGQSGAEVFFPAPGYKWSDLKAYNRMLRVKTAKTGWSTAQAALAAAYEDLMTFIEGHSQEELYGAPMRGAKNAWTAGRWAEAAGPSHFRSAAKWIRAELRLDQTET